MLPRREIDRVDRWRDLCSFQHHVGGVPLAESKQTCQSTCSPPHGSRSTGMVGVVLGYDRVATAAAGFKGKVPFDIDF